MADTTYLYKALGKAERTGKSLNVLVVIAQILIRILAKEEG